MSIRIVLELLGQFIVMTWGYNDDVCPPTTSYIVWNLITAPKESLITPINEHWTTTDTNYGQMLWIKARLKKLLHCLFQRVNSYKCKFTEIGDQFQ